MPRIQFGIKTGQGGYSYEDLRKVWAAADELGYDSAWLYDHFYSLGNKNAPCLEAWTTLAALAAETKRLRIGTMVSSVSYRHPSLLAKMGTTVDIMSGGRLILGLGAGWYEEEYRAYGYDFPDKKTRVGQLREALIVIDKLWTEEHASFDGKFYTLTNALSNPKPLQKPRPKMIVGISAGRVTMPYISVRYADGFNTPTGSFEECRAIVDSVNRNCEKTGRNPEDLIKSWQCFMVLAETRSEVEAIVDKKSRQSGLSLQEYRNRIEERGFIIGTADDCVRELLRFKELGINYFIPVLADDTSIRPLEVFRDTVMPQLR